MNLKKKEEENGRRKGREKRVEGKAERDTQNKNKKINNMFIYKKDEKKTGVSKYEICHPCFF